MHYISMKGFDISKVVPLTRFAAKSCLLWISVVEAMAGDYCLEWQ